MTNKYILCEITTFGILKTTIDQIQISPADSVHPNDPHLKFSGVSHGMLYNFTGIDINFQLIS